MVFPQTFINFDGYDESRMQTHLTLQTFDLSAGYVGIEQHLNVAIVYFLDTIW